MACSTRVAEGADSTCRSCSRPRRTPIVVPAALARASAANGPATSEERARSCSPSPWIDRPLLACSSQGCARASAKWDPPQLLGETEQLFLSRVVGAPHQTKRVGAQ